MPGLRSDASAAPVRAQRLLEDAVMRRLLPLLLISCAGVGGVTERSFERGELEHLELKTIDLVVVAKGPPLAAGDFLQVTPFEAPHRSTVLEVDTEDAIMRDSLAAAIQSDL